MPQKPNSSGKTRRIIHRVIGLLLVLGVVAVVYMVLAQYWQQRAVDDSTAAGTVSGASQDASAMCHMRGQLPDPICTPGAIDQRVTQANIHETICVPLYSEKILRSSNTTPKMKRISMEQYGFAPGTGVYEYDHLISLELGGAPLDTKNLWPEPGTLPNPKDKVENKLHSLVCSGKMLLAEAQQRIASDWTTAVTG